MTYSDNEFYDCDNDRCITFDDILERAESEEWEEFDVTDHLDNHYNSLSELWHDIESEGTDGVTDKIWDERRDEIYGECRDAADDCDEYGAFTINGDTYKCMSKWEVTFC